MVGISVDILPPTFFQSYSPGLRVGKPVLESGSVKIAVVILNWNGAADTLACLQSLRASTIPLHAIVVDNGSADGSADAIRDSGLADEVIVTGTNLGFAEGNNVGLRRALENQFDVVVVLNNDTIVEADALERLLEELRTCDQCAVSPVIEYLAPSSGPWFAGGIIDHGWPRHLQASEITSSSEALRRSDCLTGCCIAAHRDVWVRVGLFDPDYFLIFEDSDWSVRAARAGVALQVLTRSMIKHRVSRSFDESPASLLASYYFIRNGLRFESRFFARYLPRFIFRWLIRPVPALIRSGQFSEVMFRWLGAIGFVIGQRGRATRVIERWARDATHDASA